MHSCLLCSDCFCCRCVLLRRSSISFNLRSFLFAFSITVGLVIIWCCSWAAAVAFSIFLASLCLCFISLCRSFSCFLFLCLVWLRRIVLCTVALFWSHPAIDCFPVVVLLIFICCSTLFAIAFLCDLKYVRSVSVSDFKNVFRCTKRNSLFGRAFCFKHWSFRISDCNFWRVQFSVTLLLSSPWTSLFLCSQTLMWKRSNSSIIFAPHTNDSHGLVPSVDESDLVDSYRCNHLLLSLPRNILYHPILACEYSVGWIGGGYLSTCTAPVSSHSVATLHTWSINACPVRFYFISILRFFTSVCRRFNLDASLHRIEIETPQRTKIIIAVDSQTASSSTQFKSILSNLILPCSL